MKRFYEFMEHYTGTEYTTDRLAELIEDCINGKYNGQKSAKQLAKDFAKRLEEDIRKDLKEEINDRRFIIENAVKTSLPFDKAIKQVENYLNYGNIKGLAEDGARTTFFVALRKYFSV